MDPITSAEIYQFFQQNKTTFLTRNELIKRFLTEKLDIKFLSQNPELDAVLEKEVAKLAWKLNNIISNVKIRKNSYQLDKTMFMTTDKSDFLLKLYRNCTSEREEFVNEADIAESDVKNKTFYFSKISPY